MHDTFDAHAAVPADLPRLLMRRAVAVAVLVLGLALVLGLGRMRTDMDEESAAARSLASLLAGLGSLAGAEPAAAMQTLSVLRLKLADQPPHHLQLLLHDADGQPLLQPAAAPAEAAPVRALLALHRALDPGEAGPARARTWPLARPDGRPWTVTLRVSPESERREALFNLLGTLGLLLVCVAGLLLVTRWNVHRGLQPLDRLLAAIQGPAGLDARALRALPVMPIRELERLAAALRQLAQALDEAERRRRMLSQQVLTLQEDERARLARDLHDEFGQRLTALRVDAAWLARQVAGDDRLQQVVDGMVGQCSLVQQDIRSLLTRLQPFGPASAHTAQAESLARGVALLQALVASWQGSGPEPGLACMLDLAWQDAAGQPQIWPEGDAARVLWLPRPLWLALYRISQEALTNVARHAGARSAGLRLRLRGGRQPGDALQVDWQAWDDGIGLPPNRRLDGDQRQAQAVLPRGNGLAGLQERVWAQGGTLQCDALQPGGDRPGLHLAASFHTRLLPALAAAD